VRLSGDELSERAESSTNPRDKDSMKFLEFSILLPLCGINYRYYVFCTISILVCQVKNIKESGLIYRCVSGKLGFIR
jgi:hypothetical protein